MKKTRIILGVLAICLLYGGLVWAGGGSGDVPSISWWQINGGGESIVSGSTTLHSTIGQWAGSGSASSSHRLCSGFWYGAEKECQVIRFSYLPVIIRSEGR